MLRRKNRQPQHTYTKSICCTLERTPFPKASIQCLELENVEASNRNDDPAGVRWINGDLTGFTYIE